MKHEKNHKFKKGDKFVIEIAECHTHWADDGYPISLYRMKGFATLVMDDKGLERLQKLEDLKEIIQTIHDSVYQEGYEKGKAECGKCSDDLK